MLTRFQKLNVNKMADIKELKQLIEKINKELGGKIDNLVNKLNEKDRKIEELEKKVTELELKAEYSDKRFQLLERRIDDGEQYSRRTSLRISGIPLKVNETAEESLGMVKEEVQKLGLKISDCEFDRAHGIGHAKDRQGTVLKERQMIVKFSSFRARTLVYRNRKKGPGDHVRFYIDQTKRRFDLRKKAVEYVKDKPDVDFVFADVNCSLCIRFKSGRYDHFNSEDELFNLVG